MVKFEFLELFGEIDDDLIRQAGQPWKRKKKLFHIEGYGAKIACAVIIIAVLLGSVFHTEVRAAWEKFTTMISRMLGVSEDLAPYTEIKDIPIINNGMKLTLKEIILDNDELLILLSQGNEDEEASLKEIAIEGDIWIDSQELIFQECYLNDGGLDKTAQNYVLGYYIDDDITVGNIAEIKTLFTVKDTEDSIIGEFEYHFTASKEEMEKNTETISLNQTIKEAGTIDMKLNKLTLNSISSRIYGVCPDLILGKQYYLIGSDNLGNPITYNLDIFENPNMIFVKDKDYHIAPEATSMELQLFVHKIDTENVIESSNDGDVIIEDTMEESPEGLEAVADKFTLEFK